MGKYKRGNDFDGIIEKEIKKEIRINAFAVIFFLFLGIVSIIKGEVWWVPCGFFAFCIYGLIETIKSKKEYDDYKSS